MGAVVTGTPRPGPPPVARAFRGGGDAPSRVQRSALRVSSPEDAAEREATVAARAVMTMSAAPAAAARLARSAAGVLRSTAAGLIQRQAAGAGEDKGDAGARIHSSLAGGTPLPATVRRFMEPRFGADFGGVRIHLDADAAALNRHLAAQAFTTGNHIFFGRGQYQPETAAGRELIAHELAHTVQQGTAPRAAMVAQRSADLTLTPQPRGLIQRVGIIDTALNYVADKVNLIPGFRMFTIVLGVNPVNMSAVDASPANILRAVIEFIPGASLVTQALDNSGVFEKVAAWAAQQIKSLGMIGSSIKKALMDFLDTLDFTDVVRLGWVWDQAKAIFTGPIDRIKNFVKGFVAGIVQFVKDAILIPIAKLAQNTPSYDLLKGVMGKDPITDEPVADSADLMIGGFMTLINQQDVWENTKKSGAIPKAWAWFKGALSDLKAFVLQIPPTFVAAFKALQLADIILVPLAFAKLAGVFGTFLGRFVSWAGNAMWNLLEIIFSVVKPGALDYVKRTGAALKSILKNPLPFVGNLAKAAKLGFENFSSRFGKHLQAGLIDWLTGSLSGVYIPKALSLGEIVKFAFSVLGLTWQNLRAKLVKVVGDPAVQALEKGFQFVKTLVTEGPAAAWEQIKDELIALKDKVVDGIKDMVIEAVVTKAIPKLLAMFIPGAGFISAIVSIYDMVMVFVRKIAAIVQVVTAFVDSIVAIAGGAIGAAAGKVESILAGLLSLAINFLAGFAGLGKIASKINGIIQKIRAPIDKALDSLAAWIKKQAKKFLDALGMGVKKLVEWWKRKKRFQAGDESHELSFSGEKSNAVLMVESNPKAVEAYVKEVLADSPTDEQKKAAAAISPLITKVKAEMKKKESEQDDALIASLFDSIATQLAILMGLSADSDLKGLTLGRHSFTVETKRELKEEFKAEHKGPAGTQLVRKGMARRHVVSSKDMAEHYERSLNKKKWSLCKALLLKAGTGEALTPVPEKRLSHKAVIAAAKARHAKFFNYTENLFIGPSARNSALGRTLDPDGFSPDLVALEAHITKIKKMWAIDGSITITR